MIPFRVDFRPGVSIYEQIVYAAKKAIISGQIRPGDPFPSVRTISKELKINPNTAHKVVTALTAEGVLAVYPGVGTVVAQQAAGSAADKSALIETELEKLVIEAHRLGLSEQQVAEAVKKHWAKLFQKP